MRQLRLSLFLSSVLIATSCTSGGPQAGSPSASGPIEISMWHIWGGHSGDAKAIDTLVKQWNAAHPDIHVTARYALSGDNAPDKVLTAIAGGSYPDIAYIFGSWAGQVGNSPKTVQLNNLIQQDPSYHWNDFWPSERANATVNGRIVGVPALVDNLALVYNKTLFDRAHVPYPTPNWTWADFENAAMRLTDPANKQWGFAFIGNATEDTVWHYDYLLWQAGGAILTPDGKHAAFDSPAGLKALDLLYRMTQVDKSTIVDAGANGAYWGEFKGGSVAMLATGPWDTPGWGNVNYGVQTLPGLLNQDSISGPDNWMLFDNGQARVQAAWQFLKWFTSPPQVMTYSLISGELPTRQSVVKLPQFSTYTKKFTGADVWFKNMGNVVKSRPFGPIYPKVSQVMGTMVQSVVLGQTQPKQALDQAAQQVNQLLASQP